MSCGKPIGHLWKEFSEKTKNRSENIKETLDKLEVTRYCCRGHLLGHVDLLDTVSAFKKF